MSDSDSDSLCIDSFEKRDQMKKRKSSHLLDLYDKIDESKEVYLCKDCKKRGHVISGSRLSVFALNHSKFVHSKDENHVKAVELFPSRVSKKQRLERDMKSYTSSTSSEISSRQSIITDIFYPIGREGTREYLEEQIAIYLVKKRVPFSHLVDINNMINSAMAYGVYSRLSSIDLGTRDNFQKDIVENKLYNSTVESTIEKHKKQLYLSGAMLLTDSACDVNSRSVRVVVIQSLAGKDVIATLLSSAKRKTSKVIAESFVKLLSSPENESISNPTQNQLNNFSNSFIWSVATDHANVEVCAMKILSHDTGIVPCGDGSHAAHNIANHIYDLFPDEISNILSITTFISSHEVLKEIVRDVCGCVIPKPSETRFLSVWYIFKKLKQVKNQLKDSVSISAFRDWVDAETRFDVKSQANKIKRFILDEKTWIFIDFFYQLGIPLIKFCRFFDKSASGGLCFIYKFFSLISSNVFFCISDPKFSEIATADIIKKITQVVSVTWNRYHYELYSAAFLLCPHMRKDFDYLNQTLEGKIELDQIKQETLNTIRTMARRFDPHSMIARPVILSNDDPIVNDIIKKIDDEIDFFLEGSGPFQNRIDVDDSLPAGMYWRRKSPKGLLIVNYASRIVDGSPSTSVVERFHYKFSRVRTKQRNKLSYDRCEKLVFLNSAMQGSSNCNEITAWHDMLKSCKDFETYTNDDEQYLNNFFKRSNEILLEDECDSYIQSDSDTEDNNEEFNDDDNCFYSSFGRKITPKVYLSYI